MEPENVRLKRLLDKQRRALALPKNQLGELEEEYAELLSRIESERQRLGLDDVSVELFVRNTAEKYTDEDVKWYMNQKNTYVATWHKQIKRTCAALRKSATKGDIEDFKYYKKMLIWSWERIAAEAHKNQQISLI